MDLNHIKPGPAGPQCRRPESGDGFTLFFRGHGPRPGARHFHQAAGEAKTLFQGKKVHETFQRCDIEREVGGV